MSLRESGQGILHPDHPKDMICNRGRQEKSIFLHPFPPAPPAATFESNYNRHLSRRNAILADIIIKQQSDNGKIHAQFIEKDRKEFFPFMNKQQSELLNSAKLFFGS